MKKTVGIVLVVLSLVYFSMIIYRGIIFDINCGGHMERAASANSIDLAKQEMEIVVKYLEDNGLTSGYTSIFYKTPDEDVGFFYKNMRASLEELRSTEENATPLEKSNVLIKLRETLTYQGESGMDITVPQGISRVPHNAFYALWGFVSIILAVVGGIFFKIGLDENYYN